MDHKLIYKTESYAIIGACMEVHRHLGHGFLEAVYQEALAIELTEQKIPFVRESALEIQYKSVPLQKTYNADFICYDKILLELKALSELSNDHTGQVLNYLKATHFKLGILVNFGKPSLEYKRIVR